ncbi:MAG: PqqD family protein [Clostridia bacterium]|nr:PqqD family protein [Clostridia bacterium]
MKIKDGFVAREVGGETIVIAVGERSREFNAMITLNETGKFLWDRMTTDTDADTLTAALLSEYEVDEETAKGAVARFIASLEKAGLLA